MRVTLCDVGPRDGLQNDRAHLEPAVRAELCDRLAATGLPRVEAASFVHPKAVPQMAGAEEVFAALERRPGTIYAALVLNEKGFERAAAAGADEVHVAYPLTDTFAARNQNTTLADAAATSEAIVRRAREAGTRVTVTLGVSFGCPFEGAVDPGYVLELASRLAAGGADEIVFADTVGVGVPRQARQLVGDGVKLGVPIGVHLHNTRNTGLANALAALEAGAVIFDASVGGIGGCPFAPKATGNIATEDLLYMLAGEGVETGIDIDALVRVAEWLEGLLGRQLPGQVYRAGVFTPVAH